MPSVDFFDGVPRNVTHPSSVFFIVTHPFRVCLLTEAHGDTVAWIATAIGDPGECPERDLRHVLSAAEGNATKFLVDVVNIIPLSRVVQTVSSRGSGLS